MLEDNLEPSEAFLRETSSLASQKRPLRSYAPLIRYMLEDNLDPSEAFLRDYMLKAMWKRTVDNSDGPRGGNAGEPRYCTTTLLQYSTTPLLQY